MADTTKKRGRPASKNKDAKPAQSEDVELEAKPGVPEPLKGKGKRKAASEESVAKGKKETVAKKPKSAKSEPIEPLEVANENAEPVTVTTNGKLPAKKGRPKKEADAEKPIVAPPKEPKAARKTTSKASKQVTASKNGSGVAKPNEESMDSTVDQEQATTTKRKRGKPSYKDEDSDEPEYVPKPSKGRGKAKATTEAEEKDSEDSVGKKKTASKQPSESAKATTGRGKKNALVAEVATHDVTKEEPDAGNVTNRKTTAASQKATGITTSTVVAKPATATARGRKKVTASEATAAAAAAAAAAEERGEEEKSDAKLTEPKAANHEVTQRKRGKTKADDEPKETVSAGKDEAPKVKKAKVTAPKMNKCATDYGSVDFTLEDEGKPWNFKISSWNVAGLRSWVGKGGLEFLEHERPDILCVQETKCTEDQLPDEARHIPGYHPYWLCKPGGYAGVAIYSKKMPIHVTYGLGDAEQDQDGRLLTAEYEKFYLVSVYVPNAGNKLVTLPKRMRWDEKFHQYLAELNSKKPVVLCGDMNVAHEEIDLANPKTNRKNAGFTQEERDGMTKLLSLGFVDTFRRLYPDRKSAYTFWTYMGGARAKNVGWRLDYFIVSERLVDKVTDNVIRSQVYGSDHCPVTLFLNI